MIELFLKTAAAPAVVVAISILLFGSAPEPWRARIQALLFAGGFVAGCYMLAGFPPWPPQGGAPSLIYAAVWFALFSWVAPPGSLVRFFFRGIWIITGALVAVWSLRSQIIDSPVLSRNLAILILVGWGMWFALENSTRASHTLTSVMMAVIAMTAASFLFLFKSSLLMSQMMTTLAVLTGGIAVIAWLFPTRLSLHALFPFFGGFLGVALIAGMFFLEIEPLLVASMAIPFVVLVAKGLFNRHSSSVLWDAIITAVFAALPLGYILFDVFKTSGPLY